MIQRLLIFPLVTLLLLGCSNHQNDIAENSEKHPLDMVAEELLQEEANFFTDQPISKDFWVIGEAAGTEETGDFPQVTSTNPTECHKLKYNEFPLDSINLGVFSLREYAILSDVVSCVALSADGFLINEKAKSVFDKFNLGPHKYFDATVVSSSDSLRYYWLHLNTDVSHNIDYSKSAFYIEKGFVNGEKKMVHINSQLEYQDLRRHLLEEWEKNNGKFPFVKPKKIVLNENFDHKLDLFGFAHMNRELYISPRLKEAIEKNEITGFEINETRKVFLSESNY